MSVSFRERSSGLLTIGYWGNDLQPAPFPGRLHSVGIGRLNRPSRFSNGGWSNIRQVDSTRPIAAKSFRELDVAGVVAGHEFNKTSEEVKLLRALIVEFAESAWVNHTTSIICIVNNLNIDNNLSLNLAPTLAADTIAYLSSHTICPPDNPVYYLPASHFVPSTNMELAKAMAGIIHEQLKKHPTGREWAGELLRMGFGGHLLSFQEPKLVD
jgi:hypothetical protein